MCQEKTGFTSTIDPQQFLWWTSNHSLSVRQLLVSLFRGREKLICAHHVCHWIPYDRGSKNSSWIYIPKSEEHIFWQLLLIHWMGLPCEFYINKILSLEWGTSAYLSCAVFPCLTLSTCETSKAHLSFRLMTSTRMKLHLVIEYGWIDTGGGTKHIQQ